MHLDKERMYARRTKVVLITGIILTVLGVLSLVASFILKKTSTVSTEYDAAGVAHNVSNDALGFFYTMLPWGACVAIVAGAILLTVATIRYKSVSDA